MAHDCVLRHIQSGIIILIHVINICVLISNYLIDQEFLHVTNGDVDRTLQHKRVVQA